MRAMCGSHLLMFAVRETPAQARLVSHSLLVGGGIYPAPRRRGAQCPPAGVSGALPGHANLLSGDERHRRAAGRAPCRRLAEVGTDGAASAGVVLSHPFGVRIGAYWLTGHEVRDGLRTQVSASLAF